MILIQLLTILTDMVTLITAPT